MIAAAFDHGGGVVDADDAAIAMGEMTPHHQGGGTERAAEIIQGAAGLGEALGHHADGRKDVGVTGDRALDHVGKDIRDLLVKTEITELSDGRGEELIFLLHGKE